MPRPAMYHSIRHTSYIKTVDGELAFSSAVTDVTSDLLTWTKLRLRPQDSRGLPPLNVARSTRSLQKLLKASELHLQTTASVVIVCRLQIHVHSTFEIRHWVNSSVGGIANHICTSTLHQAWWLECAFQQQTSIGELKALMPTNKDHFASCEFINSPEHSACVCNHALLETPWLCLHPTMVFSTGTREA